LPTPPSDGRSWDVAAVAVVSSPRQDQRDDDWGDVESRLTLLPPFDATSIAGLAEFSHLDVVYLFDQVDPASVTTGARLPRGNPAWPEVGIFAQRAKMRPNRIGVSTCRLLSVEDNVLVVQGLDAIDGTPVLDIKPYMDEFGPRGDVHQPPWSHELMAGYF
jgi:tRNA-Thr(GGU) m(6)t(6)A37 methyltransferase TsaA